MLPYRHFGNPKAKQWLGLIDALYAIAMTLMALELPNVISKDFILFQAKRVSSITPALPILQVTIYFLGFLVLYEAWCFHRTTLLLADPRKTRIHNILTGLTLACVCLVPAWTGAILRFGRMDKFWIRDDFSLYAGCIGWSMVLALYILLFSLAFESSNFSRSKELRHIAKGLCVRCLFFAGMICYHVFSFAAPATPYVPAFVFLVTYLLLSFNQDHVFRCLRVLRALLLRVLPAHWR